MGRFAEEVRKNLMGFDYSVDTKKLQSGAEINEKINKDIVNDLLNKVEN